MSDDTNIAWTRPPGTIKGSTWNPIRGTKGRWACARISPGCDNCYAATMNRRFGGPDYGEASVLNDEPRLDIGVLQVPYSWRQPHGVFVCSMTDLFGEWVPDNWLDAVFNTMRNTPEHTYQVLTKRATRMATYLGAQPWWPLPNVWIGVSIEDNHYAWRARRIADLPGPVRFVSAEPLLGPLDRLDLTGIDWLIAGGESGGPENRRLVHRVGGAWEPKPEALIWLRDLRNYCQRSGTAFFFKQMGGPSHAAGGDLLDGVRHQAYPEIKQRLALTPA